MFVLQLVHRPTVRSVLHGLLRRRLRPTEQGVDKARKVVQSCVQACKGPNASKSGGSSSSSTTNPAEDSMKVSLLCPLTGRRIALPARGTDCRHLQCFDLVSSRDTRWGSRNRQVMKLLLAKTGVLLASGRRRRRRGRGPFGRGRLLRGQRVEVPRLQRADAAGR